jgi:carboxyl-terminal processing protease
MSYAVPAPRRRFPPVLMVILAFLLGAFLERQGLVPGGAGGAPIGIQRTFHPFWEAWRLVDDHFVDRKAVEDVQRRTQGSIAGMLASLGDTGHTAFLTKEEVQRMESSLEGHMEGIGATVTIKDRRPTIMGTLPASPAQKAGLKQGDVLQAVDGRPVTGLSLDRVVAQVRGPAGTEVRLQVTREGSPNPLDFTVKRAKVEVPSVTWRMLPGEPVVHVAIREFGEKADAQLRAALKEARAQGTRGVLVDVRANPGGLKEQAVEVTSQFLKGGEVVFIQQDARGRQEAINAKPGGEAPDLPLVVLVDGGSASSAEIFAGALQDHGRAKLVGTRTFGTGTVLQPFPLTDGSAVLLAVKEWLTPNGRQIWHQGITPDIEVALPEDATALLPDTEEGLTAEGLKKSKDKQVLRALEVLKEQLK